MSVLPHPVAATPALVLRTWPSGETSVVASLLTRDHGYVRVVAKGARAGRSTLRPLVQPGRLVEAELTLRPDRQLQYLRGGQLLLDPLTVSRGLERTTFLLAAVELIDRCRPSGEREEDLFALCRAFLEVLSSATPGDEAYRFYAFELSLLALQGLTPVLCSCAACGREEAAAGGPGLRFSPAAGGVVCADCVQRGAGRDGRDLDAEVLGALRLLAAGPDGAPEGVPRGRRIQRELGIQLHRFLSFHLPEYRLPAALDLLRAGRAGGPLPGGDADPEDP